MLTFVKIHNFQCFDLLKALLSWGWGEERKKWCCANQVGETFSRSFVANLEEVWEVDMGRGSYYWGSLEKSLAILLMAEILHQFIGSLSHYLQGLIHPRWCRISYINSRSHTNVFITRSSFICSQGVACEDYQCTGGARQQLVHSWGAKSCVFCIFWSWISWSRQWAF